MGVIDKEMMLLRCSCGAEKQASLLDKGSGYAPNPCYWVLHGFEPEFTATFVESREQMDPPKVEVHCAECGEEPSIVAL